MAAALTRTDGEETEAVADGHWLNRTNNLYTDGQVSFPGRQPHVQRRQPNISRRYSNAKLLRSLRAHLIVLLLEQVSQTVLCFITRVVIKT